MLGAGGAQVPGRGVLAGDEAAWVRGGTPLYEVGVPAWGSASLVGGGALAGARAARAGGGGALAASGDRCSTPRGGGLLPAIGRALHARGAVVGSDWLATTVKGVS